ncbi:hypothetical protein OEZ86_004095 [Tetradesmus obliquus]|nr:hypothetical protein OEZ86_004095 [Tetradesmus obliquus]
MAGTQQLAGQGCGPRLSILMVSDFFYPNFGGVENHIYQLSQCLINQGHKVVVMTHAYGDCGGVRYLTNGLKVYYLYRRPIHAQSTMPTLWLGAFRLLRLICIRENISLVHCHQAFSTLGGEALVQARTMGYKVVFTDHSLFGFADAASIATNKLIKAVLADVQHAICVSHTSKENTVLRASLHPAAVSVIPNAVDASEFEPHPNQPRYTLGSPVTIIALSRLVYRKGIDILALVIPEICHRHPHVNFIIGGDGPKRGLLEQMINQEGLAGRVALAGAIPHERAREFLLQGHIFVNASLTEAFCMAIVEAASAGLLVVSTCVGGVPEVLPPDVMLLAEPSPEDLLAAVEQALLLLPELDPQQQHARVRAMYNWPNVAQRTEAAVAAGGTTCAHLPSKASRNGSISKLCAWVHGVKLVLGPIAAHLIVHTMMMLRHSQDLCCCCDGPPSVVLRMHSTMLRSAAAAAARRVEEQRQLTLLQPVVQGVKLVDAGSTSSAAADSVDDAALLLFGGRIQASIVDGQRRSQQERLHASYNTQANITDCVFENNAATEASAGLKVCCNATAYVSRCKFVNNTADSAAAVDVVNNGQASMTARTFERNKAQYQAAGVRVQQQAQVDLTGCLFRQNSATYGGAIYMDDQGSAAVSSCTFRGNQASTSGAAFYAGGTSTLDISDTTLANNNASYGAAVFMFNIASLSMGSSNCSRNTATTSGGCLGVDGVDSNDVQMWRSTFDSNQAGDGGAMNFGTSGSSEEAQAST